MSRQHPQLKWFLRETSGAALVEFAISLPLMLILLFGAFEAQRLLWTYQATVAAVRDAARYVARAAESDICDGAGPAEHVLERLATMATTSLGRMVIPGGASVTGVNVAVDCVSAPSLRQTIVPRATVTTNLQIALPFTTVFTLAGGTGWGTMDISIVEESRIYGL
jgi:Flp pilus assembly protein TadG